MKKHYSWLWFEVDSTLFDYNRAEATALRNAFHSLTLPFEDDYLGIYRNINSKLWRALEQHEITPAVLRFRRFDGTGLSRATCLKTRTRSVPPAVPDCGSVR